jgi:hypothetical protein
VSDDDRQVAVYSMAIVTLVRRQTPAVDIVPAPRLAWKVTRADPKTERARTGFLLALPARVRLLCLAYALKILLIALVRVQRYHQLPGVHRRAGSPACFFFTFFPHLLAAVSCCLIFSVMRLVSGHGNVCPVWHSQLCWCLSCVPVNNNPSPPSTFFFSLLLIAFPACETYVDCLDCISAGCEYVCVSSSPAAASSLPLTSTVPRLLPQRALVPATGTDYLSRASYNELLYLSLSPAFTDLVASTVS